MSFHQGRTLFNGGIELCLYRCVQRENPSRFYKTTNKSSLLFYNSKNSFKTSSYNSSRWPGKGNLVDTSGIHSQDYFALSRLWKPFVFTVSVSGVSLAGAAIWQYENVRLQASLAKRWWSNSHPPKYGEFRQHLHGWWQKLSAADKVFAPICALNVAVFLAWTVRRWHPTMTKYFTSGLASDTLCWPMLLSTFSHYSILHLAANMFVLHSFTEKAVSALGKEQFLGVYLSAGVVSSLASYLFKALTKSPASSLGASGAVMCVLAYVCFKYPNSQLAIIFLPQFPFTAETGIKAIIGFDTLGCVLRWGFFDHSAHLGGSLFGLFWFLYGYQYLWKKREPLISIWHKWRGPVE